MMRKHLTRAAIVMLAPAALLIGGAASQPAAAAGVEWFGSASDCSAYRAAMVRQGYQMGYCQHAGLGGPSPITGNIYYVYVGEKVKQNG